MTDDRDDKIRRNLVVASAAVILSAALGVPFDGIARRLLSADDQIAPERLLAVGLAILAYLLARYRFSKEGIELREVLERDAIVFIRKFIDLYVNRKARTDLARRKPSGMFSPPVEEIAREFAVSHDMTNDAGNPVRPQALVLQNKEPETPLNGTWGLEMQWTEPRAAAITRGVHITIAMRAQKWLVAIGWARASLYSRAACS